ncbi:MAG: hypothetical protein ABSB69_17535 [Solirubrobacteraceae bacterium]
MTAEEPLRCRHCGDVIGVYEPLVALAEGRVCETSLAATADCVDPDAICYHRACYVLLGGAGPSEK